MVIVIVIVMEIIIMLMNRLLQQDLSYKYNKTTNDIPIIAKIKVEVIARKLHYVSSITILSPSPNYNEVNKAQPLRIKIGLNSILRNIWVLLIKVRIRVKSIRNLLKILITTTIIIIIIL